jgi:predicted peptidase
MLCGLAGCDDSSSGGSSPASNSGAVVCDRVLNPPAGQYAQELTAAGQAVQFLLFIPEQYADRDSWPLIVFLHGSGERGSDIEKVSKHGVPKWVQSNPSFPFIVVSPQLPSSLGDWIPSDVVALVDEIICRYAVDPNRIYLTGISMGGIGTWATAIQFPDRFAAIAPVSGWGFPDEAAVIRHIPAWVFHGADDAAAPLSRAQEMVDALLAVGGNVTFTVYPGVGHSGAWPPTYEAPDLYDWFLRWSL